jgi:hypothetical protein
VLRERARRVVVVIQRKERNTQKLKAGRKGGMEKQIRGG